MFGSIWLLAAEHKAEQGDKNHQQQQRRQQWPEQSEDHPGHHRYGNEEQQRLDHLFLDVHRRYN